MIEPFDETNVVFRCSFTEEERKENDWAEEYAVVRFQYSPTAFLYYARDGERWSENEFFSRAIISHLLTEREAFFDTTEKLINDLSILERAEQELVAYNEILRSNYRELLKDHVILTEKLKVATEMLEQIKRLD